MYTHISVCKYASWYRQLNIHGWMKLQKGRNRNMMFNPHFHKKMTTNDFEAIVRVKAAAVELQRSSKKKKQIMKEKKVLAIAAKTKKDKGKKTMAAATKTSKGKRKAAAANITDTTTSPSRNKKRKTPPIYKVAAKSKDKTTNRKLPAIKTKYGLAKQRLKEYKKLLALFEQWNMWNIPNGLDMFLENGKVQPRQKGKAKTNNADSADAEPEMDGDCTQDEINALLCHEEMPDSVMDQKNDKQVLERGNTYHPWHCRE